jgi:carbamoyltransferase
VEEERFNRIRHGKPADLTNPHQLPVQSIQFCLQKAGITGMDLGQIGYSFVPKARLAHNIGLDEDTTAGGAGTVEGEERFYNLLQMVPAELGRILGRDVSDHFQWIEHHLCHAASAFLVSPYENAAILSIDGIGEATSIWLGVGRGNRLTTLKEIKYPNSLGLVWTKMSRFLGFGEYGQWKVMALSGFGNPARFYKEFKSLISFDYNANVFVNNHQFQFRVESCEGLEQVFGKRRKPGDDIDERQYDIAAALQQITTEVLLALVNFLHRVTGCSNLCQAGGVALNCSANRVIVEDGPFESVFIQPAANDAGTALGACYYIWNHQLGRKRTEALSHVNLGPGFEDCSVGEMASLEDSNISRPNDLEEMVAKIIASGKVVAWFNGRMEFGPRALGNRSFLADPRRPEMVQVLNTKIKNREFFRPFAASVLAEEANRWFLLPRPSLSDAFMLCARRVRREKLGEIPAVTHINDTCRIQKVKARSNPRFHGLIRKFAKLTGVPLVLNTSLNDREPIVCTPEDVIATCRRIGICHLVLNDELVVFPSRN